MAYDNTNKGILSRNDRKTDENHPEYKGQINVDGVEYWLSGWVKERKDGTGKFFSLSVKPKQPAREAARVADNRFDDSEDVPFANPYRGKLSYVV